jgi:phosphoglycerol transferase
MTTPQDERTAFAREAHRAFSLPAMLLRAAHVPAWVDALFVMTLCVAVAMTSIGAWQDLRVPLQYGGDATYYQFVIQTILEHGWYTRNPDLGAPFGATMYDFPIPEPTHLALIRLFGLFSGDPFLCFNLFYLTSFATVAFAAWYSLRQLGTGRTLAVAGAFLFSILPYHFIRMGHLFLASYFAAPVFAAYALRLATYAPVESKATRNLTPATVLALAVAAGAGVYYAFFGCVFIAAGAIFGAVQSQRREPLRGGALGIAISVAVLGLSLLPNALFHLSEGANAAVAQRGAWEAEVYGLRVTQLLLPANGHRIQALGAITRAYSEQTPLINENATAALGVLGSFGLLAAMAIALCGGFGRFQRVAAAGMLAIVGILFGTIGGFGSLFALLVTPEIRCLNRISVFIAFFAILSTMLLARRSIGARPVVLALAGALFVMVGWIDQIPARAVGRMGPAVFRQEQAFFDRLQASVAPGTAVYELPYMAFPEAAPTGTLWSYDLLDPYVHTNALRWSFGEMRGRTADQWNDAVSKLGGAELAAALARAGFGAIYMDRRGYKDRGAAVEPRLAAALGAPLIEDEARNVAVYRIPSALASTGAPFVVVGPGRDWYPWASNAKDGPQGWSKGSADFVVGNPNSEVVPFAVEFTLTSAVAREVRVRYAGRELGAYALQPGVAQKVSLRFDAASGVSRVELDTDVAAVLSGTDGQKRAFRVGELAYGPALRH